MQSIAADGGGLSVSACQHHWRIEPPDGPTSQGLCLKCGAMREFSNVLASVGWITRGGMPLEQRPLPMSTQEQRTR